MDVSPDEHATETPFQNFDYVAYPNATQALPAPSAEPNDSPEIRSTSKVFDFEESRILRSSTHDMSTEKLVANDALRHEVLSPDAAAARHKKIAEMEQNGMSMLQAMSMVVAIIIGVAVLLMAQAVSQLGWIMGMFMILVFMLLSAYAGVTLCQVFVEITRRNGQRPMTYGELGDFCYGVTGAKVVRLVQYSNLWTYLIVVQYLAANSLHAVLWKCGVGSNICLITCQLIIVAVMMPILQLQSLVAVTPIALLGVLAIFIVLVLFVSQLVASTDDHVSTSVEIPHGTTFFAAMVNCMVVAFAFQGQTVFPEIMAEMKRPAEFATAVKGSCFILLVCYTSVAAIGYAIMGGSSEQLLKWDDKNHPTAPRTLAGNIVLILHVMTGYTINANVLNQAVARRFIGPNPSRVSWFLVTCVTELSYFVIANLVPNLADWMGLISSTNGFSLMLLFPALFALRLGSGYRYLPLHERRLHVGVVVLTVVLMFLGTISSLHQIASGANSSGGPFSCA